MPSSRSALVTVSDIGYADDLVSLSTTLTGLQYKADLTPAVALLFDLTISAMKLRAACVRRPRAAEPHSHHPWSWLDPTTLPIRTQESLTILGLTIDISATQSTQPHSTRATLTRATDHYSRLPVRSRHHSTGGIYQYYGEGCLDCPIHTVVPQDLLALDVPLNRSFRSFPPNALLYLGSGEDGLGLPRLPDQIKGSDMMSDMVR